MTDWTRRNLKRTLEWSDGNTTIKITPGGFGVSIYLYPDTQNRTSIPLHATFCDRFVDICDLPGAGIDTEWHNKGYGSLLVCLLVEASKLAFPESDHTKILVKGKTHCDLPIDDDRAEDNCKRRSHFWQRFGLVVKHPEKRVSSMTCRLSDFHGVDKEVYPDLRTTLSLNAFRLPAHAPTFEERDLEQLRAVQIDEYSVSKIEKLSATIIELNEATMTELRIVAAFAATTLAILLCDLFGAPYPLIVKGSFVLGSALMGYFFGFLALPVAWLRYMPSSISLRRYKEEREGTVEYLREQLAPFVEGDKTFVTRIINTLERRLPESKIKDCSYFVSRTSLNKLEMLKVAKMFLSINKAIEEFGELDRQEPALSEDFLFGSVTSMSLGSLKLNCKRFGSQFSHHINRLLKGRQGNNLFIYGGPSDQVRDLITVIRDEVVHLEFYPNSDASQTKRFGLKIFIREGVLDFKDVWCTWKFNYLVDCLRSFYVFFDDSLPADRRLSSKTFIRWAQTPLLASQNFSEFASEIADLSGARYSDKDIQEAVRDIISIKAMA